MPAINRLRVFICGQKEFGASVLRLAAGLGHEIVGCCCPLLNSTGDRRDRTREAADVFSVPCIEAGTLTHERLPEKIDLIIAAHSHDFIGQKTRYRAKYGAVGYHPSLLPRHRGRDAVRWTIKMNDPVAGGTIYWLNEVMDGGPIAAQEWCWVYPGDTPEDLWRTRLFPIGIRLMETVLSDVPFFFSAKERQDHRVATFEPALNPPRAFRPDLLGLPSPR